MKPRPERSAQRKPIELLDYVQTRLLHEILCLLSCMQQPTRRSHGLIELWGKQLLKRGCVASADTSDQGVGFDDLDDVTRVTRWQRKFDQGSRRWSFVRD